MANGADGAVALVDEDEDVCRLCFSAAIPISRDQQHPNQIDDENMIRLEELGWEDFSSRGFSLVRRSLYSVVKGEAESQRRNKARAEKGQDARYQLAGTLVAKTQSINAIADEGGAQVFRVLQTPLPHEDAHAEIRIAEQFRKPDFLKFRKQLRLVLGTLRDKSILDE